MLLLLQEIAHPWVPVTAWRVPWVTDGGVGLQIWRLAANVLNKQSWTADQVWSSCLGVWRGANNLTLYKSSSFRNVTQGPGCGLKI